MMDPSMLILVFAIGHAPDAVLEAAIRGSAIWIGVEAGIAVVAGVTWLDARHGGADVPPARGEIRWW